MGPRQNKRLAQDHAPARDRRLMSTRFARPRLRTVLLAQLLQLFSCKGPTCLGLLVGPYDPSECQWQHIQTRHRAPWSWRHPAWAAGTHCPGRHGTAIRSGVCEHCRHSRISKQRMLFKQCVGFKLAIRLCAFMVWRGVYAYRMVPSYEDVMVSLPTMDTQLTSPWWPCRTSRSRRPAFQLSSILVDATNASRQVGVR